MSAAILILAVGAGLACPAHMLWRMRRGEQAGCAPSKRATAISVNDLRARQQALGEQIESMQTVRRPAVAESFPPVSGEVDHSGARE